MPSTLFYDREKESEKAKKMSGSRLSKPRRTSKGPRGKAASQKRLKEFKKRYREAEEAKKAAGSPNYDAVTKGRKMLKDMGESGPEIRKHLQMKRNKGLQMTKKSGGIGGSGRMYAENDTEPGAVDDDAKEKIKRRKRQLEEAAG